MDWARIGTRIALVALATSGTSCGWYTNVPSQVRVTNVEPATVTVVYQSGSAAPQFTNPTVTAAVQPGSVGVTFSTATITYKDRGAADITELTSKLAINLRVEASTVKGLGSGARTPGSQVEMQGGEGKAMLPIINDKVLTVGKGSGGAGALTAKVSLAGLDDAHYPATLEFYVPIAFANP